QLYPHAEFIRHRFRQAAYVPGRLLPAGKQVQPVDHIVKPDKIEERHAVEQHKSYFHGPASEFLDFSVTMNMQSPFGLQESAILSPETPEVIFSRNRVQPIIFHRRPMFARATV